MSFQDQLNTGAYWRQRLNALPRPHDAPADAKWYPKCRICAEGNLKIFLLVEDDDTSNKCLNCEHRVEGCDNCMAVFRWTTPDGTLNEWKFPLLGYWRMW